MKSIRMANIWWPHQCSCLNIMRNKRLMEWGDSKAMRFGTISWYKRMWYYKVEKSIRCIRLIFCGLQHFDLVLEWTRKWSLFLLTSCSGISWRTTRVSCTENINAHLTCMRTKQQRSELKKLKRRNMLRKSWDVDAHVSTLLKSNAEKGRVAQIHKHRWET
jgi:hypothetical protein